MKLKIYILTIFILAGLSSSGQVSDTTFYPGGIIHEVKLLQGDRILRAITYKPDGQVKYQWDMEKKELQSFDAISNMDTLAEYFKNNCSDYTLYQHYGNGPIKEIENYHEGKRQGSYQNFDRDGKLISKGQFRDWKKVGIWTYYDNNGKKDLHIHWFHHDFYGTGISINYTIVPVAVTFLLIVTILFFYEKYSSFSNFFISYSLFTVGMFVLLSVIGYLVDEQTIEAIRDQIGKYVFPVLTTLVLTEIAFSIVALVFRKRTGVRRRFSIIFLVIGIVLCYFLIGLYISSKMTGILG